MFGATAAIVVLVGDRMGFQLWHFPLGYNRLGFLRYANYGGAYVYVPGKNVAGGP